MPNLEGRSRGESRQSKEPDEAGHRAGQGPGPERNTEPIPGGGLTSAEVETEVGRSPGWEAADGKRVEGREVDSEAKAEEREAMRREGPPEPESEPQTRPEGSTALADPVITSNPD